MKKSKFIISLFIVLLLIMSIGIPAIAQTIIENKKWVTGQLHEYYDDGVYSGRLSKYLAGGTYIPPESKVVTVTKPGYSYLYYVCMKHSNGYYGWKLISSGGTDQRDPIHYSDAEGFSGILYRGGFTIDSRDDPPGTCNASNEGDEYYQESSYTGYWSGVVTKPAIDTRYYRYQGWVYAPIDDPSGSVYAGGSEGKANGEFSWKLVKDNDSEESKLEIINDVSISGDHYATRNVQYSVESEGISKSSEQPITLHVDDPNELKGKEITFKFSYEYTNYKNDIYTCTDTNDDGECIRWELDYSEPDWSKAETATWEQTLKVDHQYGETIIATDDDKTKSLIIGRVATIDGQSINTKTLHETFETDPSSIVLQSQNWIPINETIKYHSDLSNPLYSIEGEKWFFPSDIDPNLKDKYKNQTQYDNGDYAIPLRIASKTNDAITYNTADNFFITKKAGFQFSLPADEVSTLVINQTAKEEYENYTGQIYNDTVLTGVSEGSRYYLNIDGNGYQEPKKWYDQYFVIGKLGLSDIKLQVNEKIQFKQYLLGNPIDNPIISEQQDTVLDVNYTHSIKLTPSQIVEIKKIAKERDKLLFGFRSIDIESKFEQIKKIIPSLMVGE